MATLNTLSNLITNAKQTPSGKVEWTDTSMKGIQDEVKNLFSTNAIQATANTGSLITLSGADSLLALVENDATLSKNGLYFWSSSPVVVGYTYAAAGGGYWNFVRNPTTSPVTKITAGTNVTISPAGGTGDVTINSQSTAINATNYFVPTRLNGTTFVNSNIYDNTNLTKTATSGFSFNYAAQQFLFGDYTNGGNGTSLFINDASSLIETQQNSFGLGLSIDFANNIYKLGDFNGLTSASTLTVDDSTSSISLVVNGPAAATTNILLNGTTGVTTLTNNSHLIGGSTNSTYLSINDTNEVIETTYASASLGLKLSMSDRRFTLGDTGANNGAKLFINDISRTATLTAGSTNNTLVKLDDVAQSIQIDAPNIIINGTTNNTIWTSQIRFLEVTINGVAYNIPLWT
jgi:hypothetical protein